MKKATFYTATILFLLSTLTVQLQAQPKSKNIDSEWLYWLRLNPKISFQNNWLLNSEVEVRRFMFPERRNQVLLPRLTVYKTLNTVTLGLGMSYMRQSLPRG